MSMDHPVAIDGTTPACLPGCPVTGLLIFASADAEVRIVLPGVSVQQVREVLRAWMDGAGLRVVAKRAGVDTSLIDRPAYQ